MTIRKKDGSTYRLYGPNPLLVGQERFDDDPVFRIHNFDNYKAEVYDLEKPKQELEFEEIKVEKTEEVVVARPSPDRPVQYVEKVVEIKSRYRDLPKTTYFCLPAKIEETFDELYQEKKTHIAYNKPFKFVGATVKFTDTNFMVWTTLDMSPKYSIIFDAENKRWWKVAQVINDPSNDGKLIHCHISDLEPNFSSLAGQS
jgi:hypothetical protein